MCSTLNSKFTSEVQTQHNLDQYNQLFLAQKIFDKPDFTDDFSNMMVSWAQFNKVCVCVCPHTYAGIHIQILHHFLILQEVLPGRPFTFWQWFEGVMDLTKKHLKTYWSDGWGDPCALSVVNISNLLQLVNKNSSFQHFASLGWYSVSLGNSIYTWFSKTGPMGHSCYALVTLRLEASQLPMCLLQRVSNWIWVCLVKFCT